MTAPQALDGLARGATDNGREQPCRPYDLPSRGGGARRSLKQLHFSAATARRHRFASGNWEAYEQQTSFTFTADPRLSDLVVPPELEAGVCVFRRNAPTG
jgi:hypothetical protein